MENNDIFGLEKWILGKLEYIQRESNKCKSRHFRKILWRAYDRGENMLIMLAAIRRKRQIAELEGEG